MNDLKFAIRQLLKNPGFTAVAVLTLALGIGINTAMFSFIDAILLRPLPYRDPEQLVNLFENHLGHGWRQNRIGAPVLDQWRKQTTVFAGIAAYDEQRCALTGRGQPTVLSAGRVSANAFSLLGIQPVQGRDFRPDEESYGHHQVALLSAECWRSRFGADPSIVGQSITLDGEPFEIVGVLPPRVTFPNSGLDVWMPLSFSPSRLQQRHAHNYLAFGRLKPGVSLAAAQTEMNLIGTRMAADPENDGWGAEVYSMLEIAVGRTRPLLFLLMAAVGFVLLIACANIANLLLTRASARAREFAIRTALGASPGQIVRQLLSESLLLAALGGIAGLLMSQAGLKLLLQFTPPDLPRIAEGVHLNGWTLAFTGAITLLAGLLFGLAPAWQSSRQSLNRDLQDASRGSSGGLHRRRMRSAFVVSQLAVSLILLIGAGLMMRSFGRILSQDLGYRTENIVTIPVNLPRKTYPTQAAKVRFFEEFRDRVAALPGIEAAALIHGLPLSPEVSMLSVSIPGAPTPRAGESVEAGYSQISPDYFTTMRIPLLQGRDFTGQDRTNSKAVLIVDETFVRNFKLGDQPVGRLVNVGDGSRNAEIVGLVRDVKREDMAKAPHGEMYRPYLQNCWGDMNLTLRSRREPGELIRAIRAELSQLDRDIPLEGMRTMTQLVDSSVAQRRLSMRLLGGFAGAALLLTALGLYGVLAYNVAQRSQEIGIRMALGAQRFSVIALVMREGLTLLGIGVGLGLAGALGLTRLLRGLLFGVTTTDPLTYLLIPLLLAAVAILACAIPAGRAARVNPIEALRNEG